MTSTTVPGTNAYQHKNAVTLGTRVTTDDMQRKKEKSGDPRLLNFTRVWLV